MTAITKIRIFSLAALLLVVAVLAGCHRRPLDIPTNAIRIELRNDYTLPFRQIQSYPYNYRVHFYDSVTGTRVSTDFCGEKGGPASAEPGRYTAYAYDLDLSYTIISGQDSLHTLRARTEPARVELSSLFISCKSAFRAQTKSEGIYLQTTKGFPGFESDNVINEPDPLFGGFTTGVDIPMLTMSDDDFIVPVETSTKLCQSRIEIHGITHAEYISSVQVFVTNLASQRDIYHDTPAGEPATIGLNITDIREDCITGVFNHFGTLEATKGSPVNTAYIVINDNWGKRYLFVEDVTEEIRPEEDGQGTEPEPVAEADLLKGKHSEVSVGLSFDIPKGQGDGTGGFSPDIDDWSVVRYTVAIGKSN